MQAERFPGIQRALDCAEMSPFERAVDSLRGTGEGLLEGWKRFQLRKAVPIDHADAAMTKLFEDAKRGKPWDYLGRNVPTTHLRSIPLEQFRDAAQEWRNKNPGWDSRQKFQPPYKPNPLETRIEKMHPGS